MKSRFLRFLKKYWFCFLLSAIIVGGVPFSSHFADLYERGGDNMPINFYDDYLIGIMPLLSLIYGCLSYAILKKAWLQQLILFVIAFIYWFGFDMKKLEWLGTYIWSFLPLIFSLIGTGITAFICWGIRDIKQTFK